MSGSQVYGEALCEKTDSFLRLHPGFQGVKPREYVMGMGIYLKYRPHQITQRRANYTTIAGRPSATSLLCHDSVAQGAGKAYVREECGKGSDHR